MSYKLLHFPADHQIPWQWWRLPDGKVERERAEETLNTTSPCRWEMLPDGRIGLYIAGFSEQQDARAYGAEQGWIKI